MRWKKAFLYVCSSENTLRRRVAILWFLQLIISESFIISSTYAQAPTPPAPVLGTPSSTTPSQPIEASSPTPPVSQDTNDGPFDLCAWLPAGPLKTVGSTTVDPITEVDEIERSAGTVAKCIKAYSNPPDLTLSVVQYDSIDKANRPFNRDGQGPVVQAPYIERRSTPYGEFGIEEWEQGKSEGESRYYGLTFRRGCYVFSGSDRLSFGTVVPPQWQPVSSETINVIRSTAAQVDAQLQSLPPCGDSSSQLTTTETTTKVRVKDPASGSWVTWLLIPGIGWVLYATAKQWRKKLAEKPTDKPNKKSTTPEEQAREYELDIRTQDDRTRVNADGEDILWVYAQVRCNKPEVNTEVLTAGLTFSVDGTDAKWLHLGLPQKINGFKTVPVRAWPPSQDAQLVEGKATVMVSTILEGSKIDGPVKLDLEPKYVMEFV